MRTGPSSVQSMAIFLIAVAALGTAAYLIVRSAPQSTAIALARSKAVTAAASDFEIVTDGSCEGTGRLYGRGDFLPLDDPRAFSTGDFIGRLRALFGPVVGDEYVLRHRTTGFIITAYSAQSGPSYGGGARHSGPLPEGGTASFAGLWAGSESSAQRVAADPILARGRPLDLAKHPIQTLRTMPPGELKQLRLEDHAWSRHLADVRAPEGFPAVAARLDELVSSVAPVDWETTRYEDDYQVVLHVGVLHGQPFNDELSMTDGLEFLLRQGEGQDAGSGGLFDPDRQVVRYWIHHADLGHRADGALPRVRAAWFRFVLHAHREPPGMRAILLLDVEEDAVAIGIDRDKAAEAIR
jgi:hypothetical protein